MYIIIKYSHITLVSASLLLFALRAYWVLSGQLTHKGRWIKFTPHIIDSLLLISGLYLIKLTQFTPFNSGWLGLKLGLLLAYIALASLGLRYAQPAKQPLYCLLALMFAASIVATALTKPSLW